MATYWRHTETKQVVEGKKPDGENWDRISAGGEAVVDTSDPVLHVSGAATTDRDPQVDVPAKDNKS